MKRLFQHTWTILNKNERHSFTRLAILDILISIIDILSLAILLWIIRYYIQPSDGQTLGILPSWINKQDPALVISIFFILYGLKNLAGYLITREHFKFIGRVAIRLSRNKLDDYQHSGYEEFVNIDSSVQIRKINLHPFEFCQYLVSGFQQIITQSSLIALTIVAILIFNAKLFLLLLLILLPPVILIFYFIKKRLTEARKNIQFSNERSYQYLFDALKGYVDANIYGRNEFFLHRFISARKKFSDALFNSLALQSMPSRLIEIFAILGLFVLVLIAKWAGYDNSDFLITIGAFMAAAYKIIPGVVRIINTSGQIRAYAVLPEKNQQRNKTPVENSSPIPLHSLELQQIDFNFPGLQLIKGLNLFVQKGDFIGLTGSSGRGKTSIFNIILGFLRPAAGEILVNGQATATEQLASFWSSLSYVRQQPFIIHDSLLTNIILEEREYNKHRLESAIGISGLDEFINLSPEGLNKMITENGKNISGGQQQRIALARAFYKDADLILLDEPFNELDEASELRIIEHLSQLAKQGKMIILITHNKNSLSHCSKIISLDD